MPRESYTWEDAVTAIGILRRWWEHLTRSPQRNSDRQVGQEAAGGWKSENSGG